MSKKHRTDVQPKVTHPARFSLALMPTFAEIVSAYKVQFARYQDMHILDVFAGTGMIHQFHHPEQGVYTYGVEIEAGFAQANERTQVGDSTDLLACGFQTETMDMVLTSPTYGNRLADHHKPKDPSVRRSYTFDLRATLGDPEAELQPNNTGRFLFTTEEYRELHRKVYAEVWRVLKPGGWFVLNVKDVIMNQKVHNVCAWHQNLLIDMGFEPIDQRQVDTPGLRYGANRNARIGYEMIFGFRKPLREEQS